jgi:histidinol phosphatase-like PHP family hydrolase
LNYKLKIPKTLALPNHYKLPVTITSDAHKPQELSLGFEEARKSLIDIGFESTWLRTTGSWKEVAFI